MLTRQQIIRAIRDLHRRKEPLNITAVKRYHPELIQAVYAVKPFLGWKRAIEAAGLRYGKLKVELLDLCVCEVCRKNYRMLPCHLRKKHEIEIDDYLIDYPDADLVCETLRANGSRMASKYLPHWEKIWSREYLLDRVSAFHEQGLPVHVKWIYDHEEAMLSAVVHRRFESWNDVLRLAGLDPKRITTRGLVRRGYLDKAAVIRGIQDRRAQGLPLNHGAMAKGENSDIALIKGAIREFGTWRKALHAANINIIDVHESVWRPKRKYPDTVAVIRAIKERRTRNWPLNYAAMSHGEYHDAILTVWAVRYFGSWKKALRIAGINPRSVIESVNRARRRYPDKEAVIRRIQELQANSRRLRCKAVEAFDQSLTNNARRYFGSWPSALRAAEMRTNKSDYYRIT